jgi:hypothetical protein
MSDETLIADLVRSGVSDDLVGRVARLILSRDRHVTSRDKIDERRQKDNARQQKRRQKIKETKALAKANDVATAPYVSRDGHVTGISAPNNTFLLELSSSVETKKDQQVRTEYVDGQKPKRGNRIPPDWRPSPSLIDWCRTVGVIGAQLETFIEEFVDYWIAIPGQRGCKMGVLGWDATFRNRVRQKVPTKPVLPPAAPLVHGAKLQDGVYVMADTPEWEAWCRYLRQQGKTTPPIAKSGGWRFETLWPPTAVMATHA